MNLRKVTRQLPLRLTAEAATCSTRGWLLGIGTCLLIDDLVEEGQRS